ncbi:uncharacterized protein V1510DRAFT_428942 [Dipodascopsis tothii]|uniref:uncharacterized protein n=1 Tax=Dipodascopsis tothii TaxID=44089 RepID=UPI0034CE8720
MTATTTTTATTASKSAPDPDANALLRAFLAHFPTEAGGNESDDADVGISPIILQRNRFFPTQFLAQLSPLLRARLAYNLQMVSGEGSAGGAQWVQLLSWSSDVADPDEVAARIYADLVTTKTVLDVEREQGRVAGADVLGFRRLDAEELLYGVSVPRAAVDIFWEWNEHETRWLVFEVRERETDGALDWHETVAAAEDAFVAGGVAEADDDDYWDQYDRDDKPAEPAPAPAADDDEYYARYDAVETAIADPAPAAAAPAPSPVEQHIADTVRSLQTLALGSGIAAAEFRALVAGAVRD